MSLLNIVDPGGGGEHFLDSLLLLGLLCMWPKIEYGRRGIVLDGCCFTNEALPVFTG